MDSFANQDRQYSDGQNNKQAIPAEIQEYGFKPPVKLPDGSVEKGDYLAANHLNYLFNDVYKLIGASQVVTQKSGNNTAGYRLFANGDVEAWGRATTGTDGSIAVSFGTQLPGVPGDIQLTDTGSAATAVSVRVNLSTVTNTGFTINASNASNAAVSGRIVLWKVVYHG